MAEIDAAIPRADLEGLVQRELAQELLKAGCSLAIITKVQDEYSALAPQNNYDDIIRFVERTERGHNIKLKRSRNYLAAKFSKPMSRELQRYLNPISPETLKGLAESFERGHKQMRKLDVDLPFSEMQMHMRELVLRYYGTHLDEPVEANRFVYPFLISNSFESKGLLAMRLFETAQVIELMRTGLGRDGEPLVKFFGEPGSFDLPVDSYSVPLYVYQFYSERKEPYIVLSQQELPTMHCRIKGMLVRTTDVLKIGKSKGTAVSLNFIFATSIENDVRKLDESEFQAVRLNFNTHEKLAAATLGAYRHPEIFEKFIYAWMFCSNDVSGYPLHVSWLSQPGGGKSDVLEAIAKNAFGEDIYDGTTGTFKGIVPSFGGTMANPGFFAKCARIAAVDELMSAIRRRGDAEVEAETSLLTTLLEHKERVSGSGNHESIRVNATARAFFASNPKKYGMSNMVEIASKLNNAFMSRMLWYVMTKQHYEFIQANKSKFNIVDRQAAMPKFNPDFVAMVDYLNDFMVDGIRAEDIERIYNTYLNHIPSDCLDVYAGRSHHHIAALIDGATKYHMLTEGRLAASVLPRDIALAESMFAMCVLSWGQNTAADLHKVPVAARKEYVTLAQRRIFDQVSAHPGITAQDLKQAGFEPKDIDSMVSYELIKTDDGIHLYPHWFTFKPTSDL